MVPKVAGKGSSFKGAGLYYLHDKKAATRERVGITHTENLPTDNPDLALKIMAFTALHQDHLKAANDSARTGRKLTKPVYAYSLSWHPDEAPTVQDMLAAARDSMKALGLADHEALLVTHTDEPHPHIHVIVNRVHPQTGLAAGLSKDHLVLSRWAEAYEKAQGKIRCEQRVENNAKRKRGVFVKDRNALPRREYEALHKQQAGFEHERRKIEHANLTAKHRGERQMIFDDSRRRMKAAPREIREAFRPQWAALFRRQEAERLQLAQVQRTALARLVHYLRHGHSSPIKGWLGGALEAVRGRDNWTEDLQNRQEDERKALAAAAVQARQAAFERERTAYREAVEQWKLEQDAERRSLRDEHRQQAAEARAQEKPEQEQRPTKPFNQRAARHAKKIRSRSGRNKGKGREIDRN